MFHHPTKLTTVKILKDKYNDFKVSNLNSGDDGITLQALVNRSIYLYLTDADFKAIIDKAHDLKASGSFL